MQGNGVILSLGSVNADFQVGVKQEPQPGESLVGHRWARLGGGRAANVALQARRLGAEAWLFARVGNDDLREQALSQMRIAGIDLRHVSVAQDQPTGITLIAVAEDGEKTMISVPNANECWTEMQARAVGSAISRAPDGSVLVADQEVPAFVLREAVSAASDRQFPIVLDPSRPEELEHEVLGRTTWITPNSAEAEMLTGISVAEFDSAAEAAKSLIQSGIRNVCIKLPDGGCLVASDNRFTAIPPFPVPIVDKTGAGDAFAGALAVALSENREPVETACFGVAAAHLAVGRWGSQASFATRTELQEGVRQLLVRARQFGA